MRCSNCKKEWDLTKYDFIPSACPYCEEPVERINVTFSDSDDIKDIVKSLVDIYGYEILVNQKLFTKLLEDLAPTFKKEKMIFSIALTKEVTELFKPDRIDTQESRIQKIRSYLEDIMSEKAIDTFIDAVAYALGWKVRKSASDFFVPELADESASEPEPETPLYTPERKPLFFDNSVNSLQKLRKNTPQAPKSELEPAPKPVPIPAPTPEPPARRKITIEWYIAGFYQYFSPESDWCMPKRPGFEKESKYRSKMIKKMNNAIAKFANDVKIDDILAYYDLTIFGSGKEGIILTEDYVYYRYVGTTFKVKYGDIKRVDVRKNKDGTLDRWVEIYVPSVDGDMLSAFMADGVAEAKKVKELLEGCINVALGNISII